MIYVLADSVNTARVTTPDRSWRVCLALGLQAGSVVSSPNTSWSSQALLPFLPPDLFPFMLLIPKVLLHYFLSEQILENYCSLLKQAAPAAGTEQGSQREQQLLRIIRGRPVQLNIV